MECLISEAPFKPLIIKSRWRIKKDIDSRINQARPKYWLQWLINPKSHMAVFTNKDRLKNLWVRVKPVLNEILIHEQ